MNKSQHILSLNQLEKLVRKDFQAPPPAVSRQELLISSSIALICCPFLLAALFMLPVIGQGLFLISLALTLFYLYTRASLKLSLAVLTANLLFILPFLLSIQGLKYKLEVVLFFLLAGCVPVSIIYILLVASRIWYYIELRQSAQKNRP